MREKPTYEALEQKVIELEKKIADQRGSQQDIQYQNDSDAMHRAFFEEAQDAIFVADAETGMVVDANKAAQHLLGRPVEEITKLHQSQVVSPEQADTGRKRFKKVLKDGRAGSKEYVIVSADGRRTQVEAKSNVIMLKGRRLVTAFFRDITERRQVEEALRESEKKFRALYNNSPDMYVSVSPEDASILLCNETLLKRTGYSRKEIIGSPILKLYHDDCMDEAKKAFHQFVRTGIIRDRELFLKAKDGSKINVSLNVNSVKDESGKILYSMSSWRDITEIKKLESQLQQAQKMESIGTLAGGIAHDFNNILSSVIGFTELALDEIEKGTSIDENLQEVYAAGKRAKDLVRQILVFARQSGEDVKPIQVDMIVKEVLKLIRSSIPTTIRIRQNIDTKSLMMGNPTQVQQIVMNLCTNAAHAMDDTGGVLTADLKDVAVDKTSKLVKEGLKPGDYIRMKISDTGVGIPPDIIDSIFIPYFTTKNPGEGTGMGLALVHGIVEDTNGKITVESRLGKGSVFRVYLPITRKSRTARLYEPSELPKGTERILFVDDEAPIAKMGSKILKGLGYLVTTRTSSVEALELLKSKPEGFDLVITDMTMPNMTGDVLTAEIRLIRPELPVILCTGYSKKISDESADEIGIKAFAYKPIVKSDLAVTVRKVLDEAGGKTRQS